MSDDLPLIVKYRPSSFDEYLGNEEILSSLKKVLTSSSKPHAYLLTGPSGVGKTTIARIIASSINADVTELDAASNSGIDAVRALTELGQYGSLAGLPTRMFILDEVHGLSKNAFQAILKLLEEPPAHLYLALCTTEFNKIPDTIFTRCYHLPLKRLKDKDIEDLVSVVSELEDWQVNPDVFELVIKGATGQPRKALTLLQSVYDVQELEEAKRIITLLDESEPLTDLLRLLVSGNKDWSKIRVLLEKIDDSDLDGVVEHMGRYIISVLLKEQDAKKAITIWQLLEALVFPASSFDRKAILVAAIGRMLWSN